MVMRFPVASVVELVFGYQLLSADALCKINRNFDRLMRDCCVLCLSLRSNTLFNQCYRTLPVEQAQYANEVLGFSYNLGLMGSV